MSQSQDHRLIILSPHLDDAVLSCGGLIAAAAAGGHRVEIWTLFCRAPWWPRYSPLAHWFHSVCGGRTGAGLARRRRAEDREACRMLGVAFRHYRWRDAVYRLDQAGEVLYESCRQERWLSADDTLLEQITRQLAQDLTECDLLIGPLALGMHVDHQLARAAAERSGHARLAYYPDLPYQVRFPGEMASQLGCFVRCGYLLPQTHVSAWITAVRCYRTQLGMLEAASGPLSDMIENLVTGGELALYERSGSLGLLAGLDLQACPSAGC